ncbi:MAG: hypothetical protein JWQ35_986, partial [Bacteriovoracaceae bacterium]|nr:hypothetical protein [Bacteriovoracaceae bacterium]
KYEINPKGFAGQSFQWGKSSTPHHNFTYIRQNPPFQALYCGTDPEAEAKQTLESNNLEHPSTVVIFGIGLGHCLKAFLKDRPHTNFAILVIEKNAQIFLRAMCAQDWTKELNDDSISWIVVDEISKMSQDLMTFLANNSTVARYLKIIPTYAALLSEEVFYKEVAQQILKTRDHATILFGNSIADQLMGLTNVIENVPNSISNPGITSLLNQFKGRMCISIAAGPSANEHFETLKKLQGKIPMFACESILKPLNEYGIYPDFVTAIERDDYVPKFFRNITIHERSSLLAPTLLMKECFDLYKGHQILYSPGQGWVEPLGLDYLGTFFPGSSAGNLNLAFAVLLGFETVLMVGHNLAYGYQTNETHVKGTIDPDRERSRTEAELATESRGRKSITQDGTAEVWTRIEWDLFRNQIEQLVSSHPQINWINTAPKGSKIMGTKTMTLNDALQTYAQDPFDIYPEKMRLLPPVPQEVIDERLYQIKVKSTKTLESLLKWKKRGHEIQKKLKNWEKKISEKELKGQQVSLDFLNDALDEVLKLKTDSVNQDPHFYYCAIMLMLPAHAAFERTINEMRAHYQDDYSLKKDFLLKHKQYFEVWEKVLPQIIENVEGLVNKYRNTRIPASHVDAKTADATA